MFYPKIYADNQSVLDFLYLLSNTVQHANFEWCPFADFVKKYCKVVLNSTQTEENSVLGGGIYEEMFIYTSVVVIIICGIVFNICDSWVESKWTKIFKRSLWLWHSVLQMVE